MRNRARQKTCKHTQKLPAENEIQIHSGEIYRAGVQKIHFRRLFRRVQFFISSSAVGVSYLLRQRRPMRNAPAVQLFTTHSTSSRISLLFIRPGMLLLNKILTTVFCLPLLLLQERDAVILQNPRVK